MTNIKHIEFKSDFFTLYEIIHGIFCAIADPRGPSGSNAGFINLGDATVIFDTFLHIGATKDLIRAINTYSFSKSLIIINSHHHLRWIYYPGV